VRAVAAKSAWEHGRELAAVLVMTEASNLQCMLECKLLDFGIVERVVNLVPVPDVSCMCSVDAASGLHVPDNLFSGDLGVVVVLVNGEYQCRGENAVQMFDKLLVRDAGRVVHLGDHEELVEADEEGFD